jgi:ferrous iron transport protein A
LLDTTRPAFKLRRNLNPPVVLSLSQLSVGRSARVISLNASRPVDQRLLALGLLPGMMVKVTRVAPLGDPIAIEFQNQCVSLRKAEAVEVMVEPAPEQLKTGDAR